MEITNLVVISLVLCEYFIYFYSSNLDSNINIFSFNFNFLILSKAGNLSVFSSYQQTNRGSRL